MNTINNIKFHFDMQNETFARELYARWDSFFAENFEHIADEILSRHDKSGHVIEIEKLELNLGTFSEDNFNHQFPLRLREKLEEAITRLKVESREWRVESENLSFPIQKNSPLSTLPSQFLTLFLLHGTLPADAPAEYRDITHLFTTVLQQESTRLKTFLQTYGHYSTLQQRLVYQLNDPELEKGVELLQPSQAVFINSYIRLLRARYKQTEQPQLPETSHRNAVWFVVYAYLLNNSSSYFNQKSFVTQTILQLAAQYNTGYEQLLNMITNELETYSKQLSMPPALFVILRELRQKLSENQWQKSTPRAAAFYKTIHTSIIKSETSLTAQARESLINILSQPPSCRLFLQQLKEGEIIRLVHILMHHDSDFIIQSAKLVERGEWKEESENPLSTPNPPLSTQGLAGKTGGEFRLLKWQIIFPLLFQNRGASFNRKYFVENLLKQIAAHYNLEYSDLLAYVYQIRKQFDTSLQKILQQIYSVERGELKVESEKPLSTLHPPLSTQKDYLHLIRHHFPDESGIIIAYAEQLDTAHEKGMLEGKAGSEFRILKWQFILKVLNRLQKSTFNQHYFIAQTLQQIAAHYNLTYFDLLAYFQVPETALYLPFQLKTLLTGLFNQEKEHWVNIALANPQEAAKLKLVKILLPAEYAFIKSYTQTIQQYNGKGKLQGKTSGGFQALKWRIIFEVLFESQKTAFNKKQFVERTLTRIAAHYNLTIRDLLAWFCDNKQIIKTPPYKEIITIFNELYKSGKTTRTITPETNTRTLEKYILETPAGKTRQNLVEKLSQHQAFLLYVADILKLLPGIRKFITMTFHISLNNEKILQLLLQSAAEYQLLSYGRIVIRLLESITAQLNTQQKSIFYTSIEKWCKSQQIQLIIHQHKNQKVMKKMKEVKEMENGEWKVESGELRVQSGQLKFKSEEIEKALSTLNSQLSTHELLSTLNSSLSTQEEFVTNSGAVLLYPYLSRLFSILKLIENNQFKDSEAQIRAMFLIQYAVFGKTEFPESEMTLNKLLTGFESGKPIPQSIDLTQNEKEAVDSMLKGFLQNWPKLKNTSVQTLQLAFLQRYGKLEKKDDCYYLAVEQKAYDLLLDSCPWNFRTLKYPWMKKMLQVKWR